MALGVVRLLAAAAILVGAVWKPVETLAQDKPTIVLIGATSRTAKQLIPQALDRGYTVVGLARRPEAVAFEHERLTVKKADVYDLASLEEALTGDEVVISMVGPAAVVEEDYGPTDLNSQGTANIIEAMKRKGNKRLIVASSSLAEIVATEGPPPDTATPYEKYLWSMRTVYQDERDMEAIVRVGGLEHVILRPGFLVEEPARHNIKIVESKQGRAVLTPKRTIVTYADFAAWTLDQVESDAHVGMTMGIYSDVCPPRTTLTDWGCENLSLQ